MTRRSLHKSSIGDYGVETVALPNGRVVDLAVLRHPGAAAVVPLHADGTVTLIRQHRHAAGGTIWEIPAGKLDPGESPEVCAARELAEEVGLVGTLARLTSIHTTPAFTDEVIHLYVATGLTQVATDLDADEIIDPVRMPLAEAVALIRRGEMTDAKSIVALLLVERDRMGARS
ncbi:MAG: NUDIX hydrolase [Pseudomonadota bacterium]|nr:NUDIX hydrolase [Pseudomonadota bacterium]